MRQIDSVQSWWNIRQDLSTASLGLVPTMGALHEGHMALISNSQRDNQQTVVSIFINPAQFDDPGDLERYPKSLQQDLAVLEQADVDCVFVPPVDEIYPDNYRFRINETELSKQFCGAHRPGHFDGVLTIVLRLLNIIRPARAYFGEKDFQQLKLIEQMVQAFFLPVEIVPVATRREADGLAMSSRNRLLDPQQRRLASKLQHVLRTSGSPGQASTELEQLGFRVDYVADFMQRRLAAAFLGDIRLIDNVPI